MLSEAVGAAGAGRARGGGMTHRKKQRIMAQLARAGAVSYASSAPHSLRRCAPSVRSAGEGAHAHAGEGRVLKFFITVIYL